MAKKPEIGNFLDDEEEDFITSFEGTKAPLVSGLTQERRQEIEAMARATLNDEREKISLRISRSDLARLKSKAMQEGIPYQTLIDPIIHKYVSS